MSDEFLKRGINLSHAFAFNFWCSARYSMRKSSFFAIDEDVVSSFFKPWGTSISIMQIVNSICILDEISREAAHALRLMLLIREYLKRLLDVQKGLLLISSEFLFLMIESSHVTWSEDLLALKYGLIGIWNVYKSLSNINYRKEVIEW